MSRLRKLLTVGLTLAGITGCENSFTPLANSPLQFAIFGVLDVAEDTQWIRVTPIRETIPTGADSIGVAVWLKRVADGHRIALRDSVFRFPAADPLLGSAGVYVHNFWTAEPIQPGASYRVSVSRAGQPTAETVVPVPLDYDIELLISRSYPFPHVLNVTGVKQLAFVEVRTYDMCGEHLASDFFTGKRTGTESHEVGVQQVGKPLAVCTLPGIWRYDVFIVGSELEWPSNTGASPSSTGTTSGISNSIGFIGGAISKAVPYDNCTLEGPHFSEPAFCRVGFSGSEATMRGTVRETRCGDGPIAQINVQLRELDVARPAWPRVRTVISNVAGEYVIAGLEPGVHHEVTVSEPATVLDRKYGVFTDTIMFSPSEQRTLDPVLRRLDCPDHP